jgi:tetratricopeptide (TPR) repeat protein
VGFEPAVAYALTNLGAVAYEQEERSRATRLFQDALAMFTRLGDEWGAAAAQNYLGHLARADDNYALARHYYGNSLRTWRTAGDRRGIGMALTGLGSTALQSGQLAAARAAFLEGLDLAGELGDRRGVVRSLEALADLALAQDELERGLRLASTASKLRETLGAPPSPRERARAEQRLASAHRGLAEALRQAAWSEGQVLSLEQALAEAHALDAPALPTTAAGAVGSGAPGCRASDPVVPQEPRPEP